MSGAYEGVKKEYCMSSSQIAPPSSTERAQSVAEAPSNGVTGVRRALIYTGTRLFNPLTRRFAGSRGFPPFALVRHRGRRSGRAYVTPIGARPTADGFVIPLTFGVGADWYRNVQAAGACVIRWRGVEYPMLEPRVVDWPSARSAFSLIERVALPLLGITQFVRLRRASSAK
jgi:deazaflavin-dependent oxidoreductase (nitroreductase family)